MIKTLLFCILLYTVAVTAPAIAVSAGTYSHPVLPFLPPVPANASSATNDPPALSLTQVPCIATAVFTVSAPYVQPGDKVVFTNTSTGAKRYQWSIDGQPFASTINSSRVFDTPGGYLVQLVASNDLCSDTASAVIHVGSCSGNQTVVWYFGSSAGMRFNTTPPTALGDGSIDTREGCATICDAFGNLLFYTDGKSVWNRLHDLIPGGNNTLGGGSSSTQSALIVPSPSNPAVYYIFTTDAIADNQGNGFAYSIVDMTRDNGKGIVSQPFIPLQAETGEKLTAVRHTNGRDIWVIVRSAFENKLYSFLVTESGIEPPIISLLSITYKQTTESVGAIKVSPTGKMLAIANFQENRVEVYPFDRATGIATDAGSFILTGFQSCYGVEFSPNGSLLYVGNYNAPFGITQFDLTAGSPAAIQSSAVFLPSPGIISIGSLQLGPDGKIYAARQDAMFLGAINQPDIPGTACSYNDRAVTLPRPSRLGLPGFVQDFVMQERIHIVGPVTACPSSTEHYSLNALCTDKGCSWTHSGKAEATIAPDGSGVTLHFTSSGVDTLALLHQGECGISADTMFITTLPLPVISLGDDLEVCSTASVVLDAGSSFGSYQWQDGSTQRRYTATGPGLYWVTVTNAMGCTATDTIRILDRDARVVLNLGSDTSLCPDDVLVLRAPEGLKRYQWQDNSTEPTLTIHDPGIYSVEVESNCGTILRDTILIGRIELAVQASGTTELCRGASTQLSASGALSYTWSPADGLDDPSSPTPIASPSRTTTYTVTGTSDQGCTGSTTVTVTVFDPSSFQVSLPDTSAAPETTIALPLHLSVAPDKLPFYIQTLSATVQFRASIMRVDSASSGSYTITPGREETLHIDLRDILLTQENTDITTIHATVYLGDTDSTPLEVLDLQLNGCSLTPAKSGSVTPDSVCSISIRHIQALGETATLLTISPNPASETTELAVTTTEQGEHLLSLYNLQGQLLWRETFRHNGTRATHTIPMTTNNFGAGLYEVVLTTPTRVRTQNVSIIR